MVWYGEGEETGMQETKRSDRGSAKEKENKKEITEERQSEEMVKKVFKGEQTKDRSAWSKEGVRGKPIRERERKKIIDYFLVLERIKGRDYYLERKKQTTT